MQTLVEYYRRRRRSRLAGEPGEDRSAADVRQGSPTSTTPARATTRISRRTCWCTTDVCATRARRSTATRASASARPTSTRSSTTRRRHAAAADQRVELRALQDVRHHGSLPGHHVGAARRRRRSAVRRHVSDRPTRAWPRRRKRFEARLDRAIAGYPLIARSARRYRWRVEGLQHLDAISPRGRQPIMAFWHGRILPATYYFRRRGIVVITSENFDGEWIAGIIERFGYGTARGSTSRGGAEGAAAVDARAWRQGKPAGFTVDGPRGPARVAQPGAVWLARATGNPVLPFHLEATAHWTTKQLGSDAGSEAVHHGRARDRRAARRGRADATETDTRGRTPRARSGALAGARRPRAASS